MKRLIALTALLFLTSTAAFAHAGHVHTYMGTVTTLHANSGFTMKTTDGQDLTIATTPTTSWLHADGHAAKQSELAVGSRVVVKMNIDAKTAASVKLSAPAKK
jgi:cytolysin (calcineurin-like family phosphatase)